MAEGDEDYVVDDYDETSEAGFGSSVYYLYIVGLAGIMVMAQGAALLDQETCPEDQGYCDYAVALGVISTVTAMVMYGLIYTKNMTTQLKKIFSGFLFVWNAVGVGVTTFGYPFNIMGFTPNGYFGVWVSLAVSATLLAQVVAPTRINEKTKEFRARVRQAWDRFQEATMLTVMFLSSIIVLVVGAIQCGETDCTKIRGFGVAYGAFNTILSGILFYMHKKETAQYNALPAAVTLFFAVWWVSGFLALTLFVNQFYVLGNGYLAALVGTIAGVNVAAAKMKNNINASGSGGDTSASNTDNNAHEYNNDV